MSAEFESSQRITFFESLPHAFAFPLQGSGKFVLILGTFLLWLGQALSMAPLVGFIIAITTAGYMAAFLFDIVVASADGDAEMPDLPEVGEFVTEILYPLFLLLSTIVCCLIPVIILSLAAPEAPTSARAAGYVIGALYAPMAILAVSIHRSLAALSPTVVVRWVLRVPAQYAVACVFLGLTVAVHFAAMWIAEQIPIVSSLIATFLELYFLAVQMRVLGMIYFTNEEKLAWQ